MSCFSMPLSCYFCAKECFSVDQYTDHLRKRHVLIEPCPIRCTADGCIRTFSTCKVLRQHLKKNHGDLFLHKLTEANNVPVDIHENGNNYYDFEESLDNEIDDNTNTDTERITSAPVVDEFGISQAALRFIMALCLPY